MITETRVELRELLYSHDGETGLQAFDVYDVGQPTFDTPFGVYRLVRTQPPQRPQPTVEGDAPSRRVASPWGFWSESNPSDLIGVAGMQLRDIAVWDDTLPVFAQLHRVNHYLPVPGEVLQAAARLLLPDQEHMLATEEQEEMWGIFQAVDKVYQAQRTLGVLFDNHRDVEDLVEMVSGLVGQKTIKTAERVGLTVLELEFLANLRKRHNWRYHNIADLRPDLELVKIATS